MPDLPSYTNRSRLTIQEAAEFLNVSTKTLRRWEKQGIIIPERTPGNQRRYNLVQLQNIHNSPKQVINHPKPASTPAASILKPTTPVSLPIPPLRLINLLTVLTDPAYLNLRQS